MNMVCVIKVGQGIQTLKLDYKVTLIKKDVIKSGPPQQVSTRLECIHEINNMGEHTNL